MRFDLRNLEDITGCIVGFITMTINWGDVGTRFLTSIFTSILSAYIVHILKKKFWTNGKENIDE
jgi:fructose-specific phosphotransferase system IIC component